MEEALAYGYWLMYSLVALGLVWPVVLVWCIVKRYRRQLW